jgi:hypothetical protein
VHGRVAKDVAASVNAGCSPWCGNSLQRRVPGRGFRCLIERVGRSSRAVHRRDKLRKVMTVRIAAVASIAELLQQSGPSFSQSTRHGDSVEPDFNLERSSCRVSCPIPSPNAPPLRPLP